MAANEIKDEIDKQAIEDMAYILSSSQGRRFFMWLFNECGMNSTSFTRDSRTYFNEGRRDVALTLKSCILTLGFSGLNRLQQAESEFYKFGNDIRRRIQERMDENGKHSTKSH